MQELARVPKVARELCFASVTCIRRFLTGTTSLPRNAQCSECNSSSWPLDTTINCRILLRTCFTCFTTKCRTAGQSRWHNDVQTWIPARASACVWNQESRVTESAAVPSNNFLKLKFRRFTITMSVNFRPESELNARQSTNHCHIGTGHAINTWTAGNADVSSTFSSCTARKQLSQPKWVVWTSWEKEITFQLLRRPANLYSTWQHCERSYYIKPMFTNFNNLLLRMQVAPQFKLSGIWQTLH